MRDRLSPGAHSGASHSGCHGTHITLDAFGDDITDPRVIAWGNVAEVVEVFSARLEVGWNCGHSNGEGLSRVLATARYPGQLDDYASAVYWLDSKRRNFVEHNDPSDTRFVSTGCAVLFLNYLHHQLGFSWREIVTNGQPTLGATHRVLTGSRSTGWRDFTRRINRHYPPGVPSGVVGDNIFPLSL